MANFNEKKFGITVYRLLDTDLVNPFEKPL